MSQQHMDFNPTRNAEEPTAAYTSGYQQEQGPYFDEYVVHSQGQKVAEQSRNTDATAGQRLALAIVSLSLFVFAFMVALIMAFVMPSDTLKQFSPILGTFAFFFTMLLIAVNGFFNARHKR